MEKQCIREVLNAAGRKLTDSEVNDIFDRIWGASKKLATNNPDEWQALSAYERWKQSAELAAMEVEQAALLKQKRAALTIIKQNEIWDKINNYKGKGGRIEMLDRMVAFHADGRGDHQSVEIRAKATRDLALARLQTTFEAVDPKFFGLFEDKQGVRDLTLEIFGQDSGNPLAKKGAQAWKDTNELLRRRFNDNGGDIGFREDWGIPQRHSQLKTAKAGEQQWVGDIFGKLNREKYINVDGTRMDDIQLTEFLKGVYKTISTGGLNKITPGRPKIGTMRANRGNESRQLHFKDADSYIEYQQKYGDKDLWQVMVGHVDAISKDIALIETFGPNPDHVFRSILDEVVQQEAISDPKNLGKIKKQHIKTQALYDFVAGKTLPVANERLAQVFDTLRNLLTASRLGSATITSLTDHGTFAMMAKVNGLPMTRLYSNLLKAFDPTNKQELRLARRAGLATETLIGSLNRWGTENLGATWSSKAATTVIRASGLSAWSDAHKRAYGVTMMSAIGHVTKNIDNLKALENTDQRILKSKGITDTDFQIWKKAELEDWGNGNNEILTPESIMRIPDEAITHLGNPERIKFEAARKLLGAVSEEIDMAVITPGARDRMVARANAQRGTWPGEITRSFFLFKSFPISFMARHFARGMSMETAGGKAAYIASLVASTTILGAMAMQANDVVSGKKPREMDNTKFWFAAMLKGGALGLYGDFLFSEKTQHGQSPLASMSGPVIGLSEDVIGLTQGNLLKWVNGGETSFGADLVKTLKGFTPGANLWYTKAVTDHLLFNQLQEMVNPGYLRRMENRAKKVYGQEYWWRPDEVVPGGN